MEKVSKNKKGKKIALIAVFFLVLIIAMAWLFYTSIYYHCVNRTSALSSSYGVKVTASDDGIFFDGEGSDKLFIFYPGGKVEACAYSPMMKAIAANGIDCFIVNMPYNLAIFNVNAAQDVMRVYEYDSYILGGHSLGGAMISKFASDNLDNDKIDGLVLMGSYSIYPLNDADYPIVTVYGSNDGVMNRTKYENSKANMNSDYQEVVIEGGNHAMFGNYGQQSGDGEAEIEEGIQWVKTAVIVESISG